MSEREEIERYEKLLSDWQPQGGSGAPKGANPALKNIRQSVAREMPRAQPAPSKAPVKAAAAGVFEPGALLLVDGDGLAVYKRAVPEKEYHLVCTLLPKGVVRIEGLALDAYEVEQLGALPAALFDKLQDELAWDRDLVVFHCNRYEDALRVPREPGAPANSTKETPRAEAPAPPAPEKKDPNALARGKRLRVKFGDKAWDAVYWGRDEQGHVVAHQTHQQWALMHLDLDRFKDGLEIDPSADAALVEEIGKGLNK